MNLMRKRRKDDIPVVVSQKGLAELLEKVAATNKTADMLHVPGFDKVIAKVKLASKRQSVRGEISWMRSAIKFAEANDCLVRRMDSLGRRGKTDLLVVTPNGYVWFPELKRDETAKESKLQELERLALKNRFQIATRVNSLEKFQDFLLEVLALPLRDNPLEPVYEPKRKKR